MYTKPAPPKKTALVTEKLCSWRSLMSFRDQDQKTQTPCKLQILNSVALFESPVSRVQGSYGACVCWKLLWFHIQHQQQHPPSRSLKASRPCAATPSNPPHLVSGLTDQNLAGPSACSRLYSRTADTNSAKQRDNLELRQGKEQHPAVTLSSNLVHDYFLIFRLIFQSKVRHRNT